MRYNHRIHAHHLPKYTKSTLVTTGSPVVTLPMLKDFMGISYDELDNQLELIIESACSIVEDRTGAGTRTLTWLYTVDQRIDCDESDNVVELPYQPVSDVVSVHYYKDGELETALREGDDGVTDPDYRLLTDNNIQWLKHIRHDDRPDAIQYTYTQGASKFEHLTKLAILNIAVAIFDNKGDEKALTDGWLDRILLPLTQKGYYV